MSCKIIAARGWRPGTNFFVALERMERTTPAIYTLDELMGIRRVRIEAWCGRNDPAQCHRCQLFRHSSHQCHRAPVCVRCGKAHTAANCDRPAEDPATCANCGGPHLANYRQCSAYLMEARNKRASLLARTGLLRRSAKSVAAPSPPATVEKPPRLRSCRRQTAQHSKSLAQAENSIRNHNIKRKSRQKSCRKAAASLPRSSRASRGRSTAPCRASCKWRGNKKDSSMSYNWCRD